MTAQNPATYGSFFAVASIAAPASSSTAVESHVPPTSWLRGPSGTDGLITRSPKPTRAIRRKGTKTTGEIL